MMGILTIYHIIKIDNNEPILRQEVLESPTLKQALQYVNLLDSYTAKKYVYSTFNKDKIENTVNLIKR